MSHTNSTTNYGLPQFLTGDKPAWLTDINNAFVDIDTGMSAAQSKADTAFTDAGNAQTDATTAINNAAAADAKGSGALASIESIFDPTTIYSVGAKVIYNNLLYRCVVAVTTPGPWTGSTNWERITVDTLISATESKIGQLTSLSTTDKSSTVNAINEVNGNKADKTAFNNMFLWRTYNTTYSIPANSAINFRNSFIDVPDGYSVAAITEFTTNQDSVVTISCRPKDTSEWAFQLRNTSSSAKNNQTFTVKLLLIKREFIS